MKNLSILLLGILCLSLVSSLNITPEYNSDIIVKDVDSPIIMTLNITNASEGSYNLYTLADISITPSDIFRIEDGSITKEFIITAKDELNTDGYYTFTYTLNHRDVEKIDKKFTVKIINLEETIEISSDSIDPESGEVSFYVQNLENTQINNLSATFSSILFNTEKTFDLGPKEKVTLSVDADENKLKKTKAGIYIIEATFHTKNGDKKIDGNLFLGEKKGVRTIEDKSGILVRTQTITKVNVGNVVENVEITTKKNILSRLFTTFNIEPTIVDRKFWTVEYTWVKEKLNPADTYNIKVKTNYALPFLIIIAIILVTLGVKRFSETKLEIKKSVNHVRTKNGEFALKVTISAKARTEVENVSIVDKVPAIVKIYNKFGMIKPDKIDAKNRRIHWNIGDLEAGEERIFTYIIYSKVGVVGKFSLPEALAIFEKEGKIHEIESNQVFFMSDQVRN
jgi:hypothetical protein